MGAVQGKFEVMKQSCPAAGVAAFARAKFELLQREHSQRSTSTSSLWRRLALLALCCVAPTAFAADLQARVDADENQRKGEFVVMVQGAGNDVEARLSEGRRIYAMLNEHLPPSIRVSPAAREGLNNLL